MFAKMKMAGRSCKTSVNTKGTVQKKKRKTQSPKQERNLITGMPMEENNFYFSSNFEIP